MVMMGLVRQVIDFHLCRCIAGICACFLAAAAFAAENVGVETVLSGLNEPNGLAIRPSGAGEAYEVFVAESGARRIIRLASDRPNESAEVITEFPAATTGSEGNPICLYFLDRDRLVAAVDGHPPEVRVYELADTADPLSANDWKQRIAPEASEEDAQFANSQFVGFTRTRANDAVGDMLLVAIRRKDRASGLWRIPIRADTLSTMTPIEKQQDSRFASLPTALAVSDQGHMVVAAIGPSRVTESELAFHHPVSGQIVMRLRTEMGKIVALAYSPGSDNLYGIGTARNAPGLGGVYRLDDSAQVTDFSSSRHVAVVKVADVERPAALAFAPDGALYVTASGKPEDGESNRGVLMKLTGEF
jgi:DNA-binding beta-propeller fold protein YncE